jgi:hypothetical protein
VIEKIRLANTGRVTSEETKNRQSEAKKRNWQDPEYLKTVLSARAASYEKRKKELGCV